jgi:hypothetical protein
MESKLMSARIRRLPVACLGILIAAAGPGLVQAQAAPSAAPVQSEFDAAMQAVEAARLRTARERLTSLVSANPSLSRARLELARVYYLSRDYPEARREAQQVLDDPNTPPTVRATLLAFLAQIDADEKIYAARHQWAPSLYAGLMYDSNVNIGPSRDVIDIGGVPFNVVPASQQTSDWAAVLSAGIAHTYNPGRRFDAGEQRGFFLWQSQANAYYRGYFDESDYNLGVLTLRTGPAWVVPGKWRAGLGLQGDQIYLGDRSLALYTTLNPNLTFEVGAATEVTLDGTVSNRYYWKDAEEGRDGWYKNGNVLVTHYVNNRKLGLQLAAGWADFDADEERFSYTGPDLSGGILWEAWRNGLVYARLNYRGYDFEGIEPLPANIPRDDDEWRYSVGFQHDFKAGLLTDWSLVGGFVHTDNQSNVAIYDYNRDVVNLGLSRRF